MHYLRFVILCLILGILSGNVTKAQQNVETYLQQAEDSLVRLPIYKPYKLNISKKKFLNLLNESPSFGLGKDNYFVTGVPVNKQITKHSSDAKYQISIRQRLTKTVLPYNTYLLLTYTQKAFWSIYEDSSPFKDINYNPTLGLSKPVFLDDKLIGMVSALAEHESNGRDSTYSRSWNYFSLSGIYIFNSKINFQGKIWIPFVGKDNKDLLDYRGYGQFVVNYLNTNRKIRISLVLNPVKGYKSINTTLDINFKINKNANQYLFFQFYNGYAEGLLNYKEYTSMIRIGICIKQRSLTIY